MLEDHAASVAKLRQLIDLQERGSREMLLQPAVDEVVEAGATCTGSSSGVGRWPVGHR